MMWNSDPLSREAQVWLQRFNQQFQAWLQSGRTRDDLLHDAASDLQRLLERSPAYAAQVHAIALTACFNARLVAGPAAVAALARVGALADAMMDEDEEARGGARVLLHLFQAEADLRRRARFDGSAALGRANALLDRYVVDDDSQPYIHGLRWYLRGALAASALEYAAAADSFERAASALREVTTDAERLAGVSMALLSLLFGEDVVASPALRDVLTVAATQVRTLAARTALARARALAHTGRLTPALAAELWHTLRTCGVPDDAGPVGVAPLVAHLPPADAEAAVDILVERVGAAVGREADWSAVLSSALLAGPHADDEHAGAWDNRLNGAVQSVQDPLAFTVVCANVLASLPDDVDAAPFAASFVHALRDLADQPDRPLDDLEVRALFDDAAGRVVRWAREAWQASPDEASRTRLAVLLDVIRGTRMARLTDIELDPEAGAEPAEDDPAAALQVAADRLQRIAHALQEHPDALALVLEESRARCVFYAITAAGVQVFDAGADFAFASIALMRALDEDAGLVQLTGDVPPGVHITPLARAAYDALPPGVRALVRDHHTLLVVPDFRGDRDRSLELLHDGNDFLGVSHVVARFASLHALTRTVEGLSRRPQHRRALLVSASDVTGWGELPLSREEVAAVRHWFAGRDWDAPEIAEDRVSAEFITDRLPLVAHAHIAAHGVVAGDEALILPRDARLTVDDLLRHRFSQLPLVFLNTCSLGQTRYLGAGVSRGIAHTLVEAGAPACIANLLPVEDQAASRLAMSFYRHCATVPCGEALRRARAELAGEGTHPMLWGSTVLIGDPWTPLEPALPQLRLPDMLLDEFFSLAADDDMKTALWRGAGELLAFDPGHVRLLAAMSLVRLAAGVPDLDSDWARARWDQVMQLADELDHPAAMALTRLARLSGDDAGEDVHSIEDRLRDIDEAIFFTEPLAQADEAWARLLTRVRGDRARLLHRLGGLEVQVRGAAPGREEDDLRALMDAITDAQAHQQAVAGTAELRQPERNAGDVCWNAVVMGHGNRFEDARETVAFTGQVVARLQRHGALPPGAAAIATPVLAGLLRFIWRGQNVAWLAPELAEGWGETVAVAAAELAGDVGGRRTDRWLAHVQDYERLVDSALARIDALTYEEVYDHLDPEMSALAGVADDMIERVARDQPERVAAAAAWLMGTLLRKNTFSPLDGSVPESIGERLDRITFGLERNAEARYMSWLTEGFRRVRERAPDELQRWKLGATPPV